MGLKANGYLTAGYTSAVVSVPLRGMGLKEALFPVGSIYTNVSVPLRGMGLKDVKRLRNPTLRHSVPCFRPLTGNGFERITASALEVSKVFPEFPSPYGEWV